LRRSARTVRIPRVPTRIAPAVIIQKAVRKKARRFLIVAGTIESTTAPTGGAVSWASPVATAMSLGSLRKSSAWAPSSPETSTLRKGSRISTGILDAPERYSGRPRSRAPPPER
jgi:hypothetical protein